MEYRNCLKAFVMSLVFAVCSAFTAFAGTYIVATATGDTVGANYICDGTDDNVEIQQALTAAVADSGTVFLNAGTYNVAAILTIGSNIEITGDSAAVLNVAATAANVFKSAAVTNVKIHGFEINGGGVGSTAYVIYLGGVVSNIEIYDMYIHDTKSGVFQTGAAGSSGISIHGCRLINTNAAALALGYTSMVAPGISNFSVYDNTIATRVGHGISIITTNGISIYNNTISGCGTTTSGRGIDIRRNKDIAMNDIRIFGNKISDFYGAGIYFYNSSTTAYAADQASSNIHHNSIVNCGSAVSAGAIRSNGFNLLIANNVIDSCKFGGYESCVWSGSSCKEVQTDSSFVYVMNNIISNADSIGILAKKAIGFTGAYAKENVVLQNNCFYNCGRNWDVDSIFVATDNLPNDSVGSVDPLFVDAANHDYHLKSQEGHWGGSIWVEDGVTSPCIDAGVDSCDYLNEEEPNGDRINIGLYGNTEEASKTYAISPTVYVTMYPDTTGDFVCDGVNDDVEINQALALADTSEVRNAVYLTGPATYKLGLSSIVVGHTDTTSGFKYSDIEFTGDSTAVVALKDSAGWYSKIPMIKVLSSGRDITIHGFEIFGNEALNRDVDPSNPNKLHRLGAFFYNAIQVDSLCSNVDIYDMYIHENLNDGINVTRCDSVSIHDNNIFRPGYDGIALVQTTNARIYNNTIQVRYCVGIRERNSNNLEIFDNTIFGTNGAGGREGQYGIMLSRQTGTWLSNDIEVYGNTIHDVYFAGIQAFAESDGVSGVANGYAHIHHNKLYAVSDSVSTSAYGAFACTSFNLLIENNVVDSSRAGGIYVPSAGKADVDAGYIITARNNIFYNAMYGGANKAVTNQRQATEKIILQNNCFYGNATNYNADTDSVTATGDVLADPLFADAATRDYHLKSEYGRWDGASWVNDGNTSPCINAGVDSCDFSNEPEPNGDRINIGLYGNTTEASKSQADFVTNEMPLVFSLSQNVPNPFNPSTTISYSIGDKCMVKLVIFNITGQKIATLVNTMQAPGVHTVRWQPEHLASGIYFCRLQAGTFTKTTKLVFMK